MTRDVPKVEDRCHLLLFPKALSHTGSSKGKQNYMNSESQVVDIFFLRQMTLISCSRGKFSSSFCRLHLLREVHTLNKAYVPVLFIMLIGSFPFHGLARKFIEFIISTTILGARLVIATRGGLSVLMMK